MTTNRMTDKERILTEILSAVLFNCTRFGESAEKKPHDLGAWFSTRKPQKGDIVACVTSGTHEFTFGFCEQNCAEVPHELLIREFGSDRTCRVGNESFRVLENMYPGRTFDGDKYQFLVKLRKAFHKYSDEYCRRFAGVTFHDDQTATIAVRKRWSDAVLHFTIHWTPSMTIKATAKSLEEVGWLTAEFPPEKPKDVGAA